MAYLHTGMTRLENATSRARSRCLLRECNLREIDGTSLTFLIKRFSHAFFQIGSWSYSSPPTATTRVRGTTRKRKFDDPQVPEARAPTDLPPPGEGSRLSVATLRRDT